MSVGATERFIQAPLVLEAFLHTTLGAFFALGAVSVAFEVIEKESDKFLKLLDLELIFLSPIHVTLFVGLSAVVGIGSSWRASRIFLRQSTSLKTS